MTRASGVGLQGGAIGTAPTSCIQLSPQSEGEPSDPYAGVAPLHAGLIDIARWAEETYLAPFLDGRPFHGPDALAYLAQTSPEAAKSHDRRITALNQFYGAAAARHLIPAPPSLTELRSGLDRADGDPKKLEPRERAVLLTCIGMWGPTQARHYRRDRLIAYLLLERMRPGEIVRLDNRHLYEQPDGGYEVRAPDYEFEAIGKQFVLDPLAGAALKDYLPSRPRPADGVHELILGQGGRPIVSRYPNMLVRQIADLHPILAQRQPPRHRRHHRPHRPLGHPQRREQLTPGTARARIRRCGMTRLAPCP
ncbi:hypothetical protein [Streptomyces sp. NPDC055140]